MPNEPAAFDTPVLFLLFNRPDTTAMVFEQIRKIQPKQLFIAADGPRKTVPGEAEQCAAARDIVNHVDWNCTVQTLFQDENAGCGPAVSAALTWFFQQVPEGIILEDDCLPDLSFFPYCAELLKQYREVEQVKLIGGNNFQNGIRRGSGSYYFSHYPEIWGWAAWRRTWQQYDFAMTSWQQTLAAGLLKGKYLTHQEEKYWHRQFTRTAQGQLNTWDYQLVFSILKNGGIAISPQVNLVKNIGLYNGATHTTLRDSGKELRLHRITFPLVHPKIAVDQAADHYTFLWIYSRSINRLLRILKENGFRKVVWYIMHRLRKRQCR